MVGITPLLSDYDGTKKKTVNFNRNLAAAVKECRLMDIRVEYLPLHLHFLDAKFNLLQPIHHYFDDQSQFTLTGGLVLRQVLFQELGILPLEG